MKEILKEILNDHFTSVDHRCKFSAKSLNSYGKLLNRFQCSSACVELRRAQHDDGQPLYRVIEFPRSSKSQWNAIFLYFDFSEDAIKKFKSLCDFWLG